MNRTLRYRIAALSGFVAVALGAFGAHGLQGLLVANETGAIWETAVFYHFIHTVVALLIASRDEARGPWGCFLVGILIFSGSLYLLAVTKISILGAITPLGGVSFLAGWVWLALLPAAHLFAESNLK